MKDEQKSAYLQFSRDEWRQFRQDMPLTLSESDLCRLHGQLEVVSMSEVQEIYLPLSRLLSFYVTARQELYRATTQFLGTPEPKVPYIIGLAGSVAVGKSMTSRVLQALLSHWPNHPHVELITTDGFLYPTIELERQGILNRKGFPESYNVSALLQFLYDVKAGKHPVYAPVYSHHRYDVIPNERIEINQPDILIVEGLNILQTGVPRSSRRPEIFVSDYFDFTIFVDAELALIRQWYIERVLHFYKTVFKQPNSYFHHLTQLSLDEVRVFAGEIWREVNEVNLHENILPFKNRAQLILTKGSDHLVQKVQLRKI